MPELSNLTDEERIALVALVELFSWLDTELTDDESEQVHRVIEELGEDNYRTAAEEGDRRFRNDDDLREFLKSIQRQEAREVIYETVLEVALADTADGRDRALLDWLAQQWNIVTNFDVPESEGE